MYTLRETSSVEFYVIDIGTFDPPLGLLQVQENSTIFCVSCDLTEQGNSTSFNNSKCRAIGITQQLYRLEDCL